ncbi:MAG TPA: hypothetical protein DEA59_04640, partial [Microbacterium sp.]|nr:hypothetical protein [Microbacterium sp.]
MTETATAPDQVAAARLAPVVTEVVDIRRQIAQLQAREARALAHAGEIADAWAAAEENMSTADLPRRSVAAELATALRVSDRTVQRQIGEAARMVEMFPETVRSLGAGRISLAHARVIVEAGDRIEHPELAAEYENSVLGYAEAESASRLRPIARRRAQWFLNETIRERHAKAAATRSVQVHDLDDGMAELQVTGPAVIIHGVHDRLTRMARDVAEADAEAIRNARDAVQAAVKAERAESRNGAEPTGSGAKTERNEQSAVDRAEAHLD